MIVKQRTVAEFLAELDEYDHRVPLDQLTARMEELDITLDDVNPFVHFGRETYKRNLMHVGRGYQALVLCWRSGQRSPIHDHHGSSCGVRVIRGTATETFFGRTAEGYVYAASTRQLAEGSVCGSQDSDIHQMSNLQPPGQDLITLHVYSPPLLHMGVYSLTDTTVRDFIDPIAGLCDGDGI